MPWKFIAVTDIGSRSEQQDRLDILHSKDGRRHLVIVADGMGGLQNGAQAAQTVVDVAAQHFSTHTGVAAHTFLQNICLAAHHAINELQQIDGSVMGTTIVLLYIDKQRASWSHVGDSRLYHFHKSSLLTQTNDHSLRQLMLTQGLVDENAPAAKVMQNKLYMRLGGEQLPEPDFNSAEVQEGDSFLLCSDGLWQTVPCSDMIKTLEQYPAEQDAAEYLVDLARQRGGDRCDNISLVVAQWQDSAAQRYWHRLVNIFRGHHLNR
jgi:serine/threonine protein phosphatase PrpC